MHELGIFLITIGLVKLAFVAVKTYKQNKR